MVAEAGSFEANPMAGLNEALPITSNPLAAAESLVHVGGSGSDMPVDSPADRTAGQSVYYNDLIMSEIYDWVHQRQNLRSCMLVSWYGYWTAARILYAAVTLKKVSNLLMHGCSMSRLGRVMSLVKSLECDLHYIARNRRGSWRLETTSPFEQFANLEELVVSDRSNYYLANRFAERHIIAGRQLTIWSRVEDDRCSALIENLIDIEGSNGTAPLLSLSIGEYGRTRFESLLTQLTLSGSSRTPTLLARFSGLRDLAIGGHASFDIALLPTIRKYCPNLRKLSISGNGWSCIPPALREPGSLREICLTHRGYLHWLYDLRKYETVQIRCVDGGTEDRIEEILLATAGPHQQQSSRIGDLKVDLDDPYAPNAAKFIAWQTKPLARVNIRFWSAKDWSCKDNHDEEERFDASLKTWKDEFNKRDEQYHNRGGRPLGFRRIG